MRKLMKSSSPRSFVAFGRAVVGSAAGAFALGACSVGAFAIGAFAVRRLAIRDARIAHGQLQSVHVHELTVDRLNVKVLLRGESVAARASEAARRRDMVRESFQETMPRH